MDCEDCTARKWFASCVVLYILSVTYLYGVLCAARYSLWWEAVLTMGMPMFSYIFFVSPDKSETSSQRMKGLIIIESSFNVLVFISKFAITYLHADYNMLLNTLFVCFFALQTYGFVSNEKFYHHNFSSLRSFTLFTQICMQRWNLQSLATSNKTANVIDASGRFLVFGEDAPANAMLHYGFWLMGILYVDYEAFIPNSGTQATHFASFIVACFSGEFWVRKLQFVASCVEGLRLTSLIKHARLLTASHLFVLDAILYFRNGMTVSAAPLAIMPRNVFSYYKRFVPMVNLLSLGGCVFCMMSTVICGPYRLLCFEPDLRGPWNMM